MKYRAVLWPVGEPPRVIDVEKKVGVAGSEYHEPADLRRIIGCDLFDIVQTGDGESAVVCDDAGIINGSPFNRCFGRTVFYGHVIHVGIRPNGDSADLSIRAAERLFKLADVSTADVVGWDHGDPGECNLCGSSLPCHCGNTD